MLRRALTRRRPALVARLVATLGLFWTITGNHARIFAIVDGVEPLLHDWEPPTGLPDDRRARRAADGPPELAAGPSSTGSGPARRWGVPEQPWARVAYAMFVEAVDDPVPALDALADTAPDPATARPR